MSLLLQPRIIPTWLCKPVVIPGVPAPAGVTLTRPLIGQWSLTLASDWLVETLRPLVRGLQMCPPVITIECLSITLNTRHRHNAQPQLLGMAFQPALNELLGLSLAEVNQKTESAPATCPHCPGRVVTSKLNLVPSLHPHGGILSPREACFSFIAVPRIWTFIHSWSEPLPSCLNASCWGNNDTLNDVSNWTEHSIEYNSVTTFTQQLPLQIDEEFFKTL